MKRRRTISRPRHIAMNDKRCPMRRLLEDCWNEKRGTVEVSYEQQFRTFFKAQRLGYIDDRSALTDKGREFIARATDASSGAQ